MPLDIIKIDHCSILITDVARSRRFYRDILGLREINKPRTFDFVALWFDLGDHHIHLLLKDKPDALSPRHFALRVVDAQRARRHFQDHGIAIQESTLIPGAERFFIADPDQSRTSLRIDEGGYSPLPRCIGCSC